MRELNQNELSGISGGTRTNPNYQPNIWGGGGGKGGGGIQGTAPAPSIPDNSAGPRFETNDDEQPSD